jgi:hypothetical protein
LKYKQLYKPVSEVIATKVTLPMTATLLKTEKKSKVGGLFLVSEEEI